jgi:hypothetical protein
MGYPGTWVLGELGRRRSIASSDSWLFLRNCDTTPCQVHDLFGGGSVTGITISRRGDRVVFDNGGGYPAMVIDPRVMAAAYTLPRLRYASGAAFSEDGDTLWVAGPDSLYSRRVALALDATTGAVRAEAVLDSLLPSPGTTVKALAVDPDGPWVYVKVGSTVLLVLDRHSLAVRGVLAAPNDVPPAFDFERIIPMPGGRVIYVVSTAQGYDIRGLRARIYRYDRNPS